MAASGTRMRVLPFVRFEFDQIAPVVAICINLWCDRIAPYDPHELAEFVPMKSQVFKSVWDAIADTPEEAALLKLRSALMMKAKSIIDEQSLTRAQASKLFGVTQPRMSDLMRGKIDLFSLDILVTMLARAGQTVELKVSRVRRSQLST
jgi:predicted XRE-type DNA-binding protein